ncbi:hypothetical protein J5X84_25665 [Streptosporangiaceae bacterium NEAU-GS5]|nr:hypothetical protein [Streptosporangiaceae bacterium NEAU-GS5]
MTDEIANLSVELNKLAETPAPPMNLDVAAARGRGRRRLRHRRIAVACGTAAVALAVGLTVSPILRLFEGSQATTPAVTLSDGPNPLIAHASFGWLPDWIVGVGYQAGPHGDQVLARGTGDLEPRIILSLYPSEPDLEDFADGGEQIAVSAGPVNGRSAYWLTHNAADPLNDGDSWLRWQTPDGQWAELHAYYLGLDEPESTLVLLHVAAGVRIDEQPVALPIHISDLPSDFRIREASLWRPQLEGTGAWELQLFYSVGGSQVLIDVSPQGTKREPPKASCTRANGLDLCVQDAGGHPPPLVAIGGPEALLGRITSLGPDEHHWTTRVIG